MNRNYQKLDYAELGRDLLATYDLDPLYPMVVKANLPKDQLKRWLLAYWCYYSAGVASHMSEIVGAKAYYKAMDEGLASWPRGHERRHFRGRNGIMAIDCLRVFGNPEDAVDFMICGHDFQTISDAVQTFVGFGPWISWKIADMAERVMQRRVDFSSANLYMYKDPVKGAALVKFGDQHHTMNPQALNEVILLSLDIFSGFMAPPFQDRPLNIQEIETILCKWKSHMNGHYPLGNDCYDIAEGLKGWGDTADLMYDCLQECVGYEV